MSSFTIASRFRLLPILYCALALSACSSSGYKKADSTASGITETRAQLDLASRQISTTISSMTQLINATPANAEKLFKSFSKNIADLEKQAAKVGKTADDMRARGTAYFTSWEQESALLQNPDLKEQAAKRRQELQSLYGQIDKYMQVAKQTYRPFIQDLRDVERFLSNDLTPAGRAAIRDQAQKTTIDSEATQKAVDNATTILSQVAAKLSSS